LAVIQFKKTSRWIWCLLVLRNTDAEASWNPRSPGTEWLGLNIRVCPWTSNLTFLFFNFLFHKMTCHWNTENKVLHERLWQKTWRVLSSH
jgi:hypothetical protein